MLLAAEALAEKKIILVADAHAHTNGFDKKEVSALANSTREKLERVVGNLGWGNWRIVLSSDLFQTQEFESVLKSVSHENPYVRAEVADILFFESFHGANLKIGWALFGSRDSSEVSFDSVARKNGSTMSFVYLKPGVTLDSKAPRAPPYFCGNPEARILLEAGEGPERKLSLGDNLDAAGNFLKGVVRMFEGIVGGVPNGELGGRLAFVIRRCVEDV
ncbi:MAG: hypothetical protein V1909_00665 [Candidatus Micrarchaeota archaeon]